MGKPQNTALLWTFKLNSALAASDMLNVNGRKCKRSNESKFSVLCVFCLIMLPFAEIIDNRWMWSIGGMILIGEDQSIREKPAPLLLRSLQISHGLVCSKTWMSVVKGQQLTPWAMTQTEHKVFVAMVLTDCSVKEGYWNL
jgi:hypothetical protein